MPGWLSNCARRLRSDRRRAQLLCGRDRKYGEAFWRVATGTQIEILRPPYRSPKVNAICERFFGSVRKECPDPVLIPGERQGYWGVKEYVRFYNAARPDQGWNNELQKRFSQRDKSAGKSFVSKFLASCTTIIVA